MLSACSGSIQTDADTQQTKSVDEQIQKADADIVTTADELTFPIGQPIQSEAFTKDAYIAPMIPYDEVYHFPATNHVTFEPGARSGWHSHGGMMILVTGGVGYYQEEGAPAQIIRKGDVIACEPGVKHWHGATPDSWFSQMVIFDSNDIPVEGEGTGDRVAVWQSGNGRICRAYNNGREHNHGSEGGGTDEQRNIQRSCLCICDFGGRQCSWSAGAALCGL